MNTRDLFERRATRGTPRGATSVWHDAHRHRSARSPERVPSWGFRFAIAATAVVLAGGALAVRHSDDSPVAPTATSTDDEGTPTSAEPLPAPLLIEGGTIARRQGGVSRPIDSRYDADDLFDDAIGQSIAFSPEELQPTTTLIFARSSDPFTGPIIGLELLAGGGFRPWGAHLEPGELDDAVDQLRRVDGTWTMPVESGFVEVAQVIDSPESLRRFGWQFDVHLAGNDRVTLQAEVGSPGRPVSEWLWVSRIASGRGGADLVLSTVEVLGRPGIAIEAVGFPGNEVVWSDGEFVYRLTSSTIEDNTAIARDATEDVGRLRLVERAEWVDAIEASTRTSIAEHLVESALLVILATAVVSAAFFLVRRSVAAAVIAGAVAVVLVFGGVLGLVGVIVASAALAIAWWRHRSRPAADSAGPPTPPPGQGPGSLEVTG